MRNKKASKFQNSLKFPTPVSHQHHHLFLVGQPSGNGPRLSGLAWSHFQWGQRASLSSGSSSRKCRFPPVPSWNPPMTCKSCCKMEKFPRFFPLITLNQPEKGYPRLWKWDASDVWWLFTHFTTVPVTEAAALGFLLRLSELDDGYHLGHPNPRELVLSSIKSTNSTIIYLANHVTRPQIHTPQPTHLRVFLTTKVTIVPLKVPLKVQGSDHERTCDARHANLHIAITESRPDQLTFVQFLGISGSTGSTGSV